MNGDLQQEKYQKANEGGKLNEDGKKKNKEEENRYRGESY